MQGQFITEFNKVISERFRNKVNDYGFFEYPITPSANISERDFCMVLSDIFEELNYEYQMEYPLNGKKIDYYINHQGEHSHYFEIKDCGIFETKFGKSLAYSKEIENNTLSNGVAPTFGPKIRTKSKTDWLNYYTPGKLYKSGGPNEGIAKDVYKFNQLHKNGSIKQGDICTCIAFVFWPQPFPEEGKKGGITFSSITKGDQAIKAGSELLIEQMRSQTSMKDITHLIDTIELPELTILDPFNGSMKKFKSAEIKLTVELLSWRF